MANVLLYNIDKEKLAKLSVVLLRSGVRWRAVSPAEYALPIGVLAEGSAAPAGSESTEPPFTDELIVMQNFTRAQFNAFLDALRRNRITIPLKAIVTETNALWSSFQLHKELCAEREAIEKGERAHKD